MIEITETNRGFHIYGDDVLTSYGHEVSVYESSSAEGPHVWLAVQRQESHGIPACAAAAHLSLEQAVAIRDRLTAFIDEVPQRWG